MKKQLSEDTQILLVDYFKFFIKLRPGTIYPGSNTLIDEYEKISNHFEADKFFEKFGVANFILEVDQPLERSNAYELLLRILQNHDKKHYLEIHKGTPFYFIGWTAYEFSNYEKAFFYLDAAVSEDLKIYDKRGKQETPALWFFLLKEQATHATGFFMLHIPHNAVVARDIGFFCEEIGFPPAIYKQLLIEKFVRPILLEVSNTNNKKLRSTLTAIYSFMSEFEQLKTQMLLRSSEGGSIEPFINHLFNGARIAESLLKIKGKGNNFGDLTKDLKEKLEIKNAILKGNSKSLVHAYDVLEKSKKSGKKPQEYNIETVNIIRNTTGHTLVWEDSLTYRQYEALYHAIANTIFWNIKKLWIDI